MWPFGSEKKRLMQLYISCMQCCSRIEILQKKTLTKCRDYKMLVTSEVKSGNFEAAEPYTDSLLINMQMEKWYRLLHAHVSTLERDYLKGRVRCSKDVHPGAFFHCLTLCFASTLVGNELPELRDIARLIVKVLGKCIDEHISDKGYTERLVQEKYSSLKHVDDDVVETFPGGLNWKISPKERLQLVIGICQSTNVRIRDEERLRKVMLGNGATTQQVAQADDIEERRSYTTYTTYSTYTTHTGEYMGGEDAHGTPTSKLVNPTNKNEKNEKKNKEKNNKKPKLKNGKKKSKGSDDLEPWEKYMTQLSPTSPGVGTRVGTGGGSEGVADGGGRHQPARPDLSYDANTQTDRMYSGASHMESPTRPGWGAPKPKFDGDSLSFGPKLDNVAGYMARRASSE